MKKFISFSLIVFLIVFSLLLFGDSESINTELCKPINLIQLDTLELSKGSTDFQNEKHINPVNPDMNLEDNEIISLNVKNDNCVICNHMAENGFKLNYLNLKFPS